MTLLDIFVIVYLGYPTLLLMVYAFLSITYYINDADISYRPLIVLFLGLVLPQIVVGMAFVFVSKIVTSKVEEIKRIM